MVQMYVSSSAWRTTEGSRVKSIFFGRDTSSGHFNHHQRWRAGSSLCHYVAGAIVYSDIFISIVSTMAGGGGGGWLPATWTDARVTFKVFLISARVFFMYRGSPAAAAASSNTPTSIINHAN